MFARYSRSAKSLRRLFLDEFAVDLELTADVGTDAGVGLERAEKLYDKVFVEYGDDSVAQLGGVHLACEQASNILTKLLEWGRLASYLEQSTRYIPYDARVNGRFRYYRDPEVLASRLGARYVGDMDDLFDTYSSLLPVLGDHFRRVYPKHADDSDFVYRQSIRAKSFDALRGSSRPPLNPTWASTAAARPTRRFSCAFVPIRCQRPVRTQMTCSTNCAR